MGRFANPFRFRFSPQPQRYALMGDIQFTRQSRDRTVMAAKNILDFHTSKRFCMIHKQLAAMLTGSLAVCTTGESECKYFIPFEEFIFAAY